MEIYSSAPTQLVRTSPERHPVFGSLLQVRPLPLISHTVLPKLKIMSRYWGNILHEFLRHNSLINVSYHCHWYGESCDINVILVCELLYFIFEINNTWWNFLFNLIYRKIITHNILPQFSSLMYLRLGQTVPSNSGSHHLLTITSLNTDTKYYISSIYWTIETNNKSEWIHFLFEMWV